MNKEIWKDIPGYEGLYKVSTLGNVYHIKLGRLLIETTKNDGYKKVWLFDSNKIKKSYYTHRLVALTYLDNPLAKAEVNHIDFNPSNNKLENLEWCTHLENVRHSRRAGRYPKLKMSKEHKAIILDVNSKKVIDIDTGKVYSSATNAAKINNIKKSTLIHYLIGSRKNKTSLRYLS